MKELLWVVYETKAKALFLNQFIVAQSCFIVLPGVKDLFEKNASD